MVVLSKDVLCACSIFIPVSLRPLLSKLGIPSARSYRCTPSGFTATRVHSRVQEGSPELGCKHKLGQALGARGLLSSPGSEAHPKRPPMTACLWPTGSELFCEHIRNRIGNRHVCLYHLPISCCPNGYITINLL